jgi:hypothetical protein
VRAKSAKSSYQFEEIPSSRRIAVTKRDTFKGLMAAAAVLILAAATPALASGTPGAAGEMRDYQTGRANGDAGAPSDVSVDRTYQRGQTVYSRYIACETCPVAAGVADADGARALIERIDANEFDLNRGQRRSVVHFLARRHDLDAAH